MLDNTDFINYLSSGGLITNYHCTSSCRHCLYACSPKRSKDYIERESTRDIYRTIKKLGCYSLHIGGGEPFLNPVELINVIRIAGEEGVRVDYIETNSSWFKNSEQAVKLLASVKDAGCGTLLLSISPFHNEFVPFAKVQGVMSALKKTGMNIFPWVQEFIPDIEQFSFQTTHSLDEYEKILGKGYKSSIPGRYWVTFRGRALYMYRPYMKKMSLKAVINTPPCRELFDTTHFHIDLFGNYVPGLCPGLSISYRDLGHTLNSEKYPYLCRLIQSGIQGLFQYAANAEGFVAEKDSYVSKCELCQDIRIFLVCNKKVKSPDLKPEGFYKELMRETVSLK